MKIHEYLLIAMSCLSLQLASQGTGGGVDDRINLDVHSISDLQKRGFPPTDDSFKYNYTSDEQGNYSKFWLPLNRVIMFPGV